MFRIPQKEILCSETSKWAAMFKSPQNGLLTLKYLRRVFYVWKNFEGYSMFRRPQRGLLYLGEHRRLFCV